MSENKEYILPVRLDDTKIPGFLPTIAYLDWHPETATTIADAIMEKLQRPPEEGSGATNESGSSTLPIGQADKSQPTKRTLSRRSIVIWLVGLGTVAGGSSLFALASSLHTHTTSTLTPTPLPGTTLFTYKGHLYYIWSVSWSPDGKRIASCSWDQTVQVWDAFTGGNVIIYNNHLALVHSVAWSPDGKRIVSSSFDRTVQVWDAFTGENILIYHGHSQSVFDAEWSPDGKRIASGSLDNTAQVWQSD